MYDKTSSVAVLSQEETPDTEDVSDVSEEKSSVDDFQEKDCINIYLREIGKISLLTPEEEGRLFREIHNTGNVTWDNVDEDQAYQAKIRVVEGNLRLVAKIAMRYRNLGLPFLDLVQEGNVGLMKAVEKFDPEKAVEFTKDFFKTKEIVFKEV